MVRHALDPLFQPTSLLVITDRPLPVQQSLTGELRQRAVLLACQSGELPTLPSERPPGSTEGRVDLVVICMPPLALPDTLQAVSRYQPRAAIILAHDVVDPDPERTASLCTVWATQQQCALLGPFSFGLQRPHLGLNLSQHPLLARPGRAALVAQSRSLMAAVMDWADDARIGFSTVIALGQKGVTRLPQVLDYLANDPRTDSIALYLEDVAAGREFMSALRAAASVKPVVVLRSGTTGEPVQANVAFDAAMRRAGAVRVRYFIQLFSALKVFGYSRRPRGRRVVVLANGHAPARLALDMAFEGGPIARATLAPAIRRRLGKILEPGSLTSNPVVTRQPLTASLLEEIVQQLSSDEGVDGVLVTLAPDPRSDFADLADQLVSVVGRATKPVLTCLLGDAGMRPVRRTLDESGASAFRTPESAANAFGILASHHYNQQLLLQIQPVEPTHPTPDVAGARQRLAAAAADSGADVDAATLWAVLLDFRVPIGPIAADAAWPLSGADYPCAIHVRRDARFGPVIQFGAGAVLARFGDETDGADLAPLNYFLAKRLLQRSQFWQRLPPESLLANHRADLLAVLELVSDLVVECPEILTLTLDTVVVRNGRLAAGQVRATLDPAALTTDPVATGYRHMSVHPYPRRWVQRLALSGARSGWLRPIAPDDAQALQDFVRELSEKARYMRFVSMMRELTPRMLSRYTQLDYHRELALVATVDLATESGHQPAVIGLAHYLRNADGQGAEYALVVADDWQGQGLGRRLMSRLIEAARQQGLTYIEGFVLSSNQPMLSLMTSLGLTNDPDPLDMTLRRVWMPLAQGLPGCA